VEEEREVNDRKGEQQQPQEAAERKQESKTERESERDLHHDLSVMVFGSGELTRHTRLDICTTRKGKEGRKEMSKE
jgi:hypothetical protein